MNNNYNKYFTETDAGLNIEANNINANCITSRENKFSLDSEGNLICNSVTTVTSNQMLNFDSIYPVGSIYMSVNEVNPNTLFEGTTWERISGRFLVGVGENTDDNNEKWKFNLGQAHGEYKHRLTLEEMPSHNHMIGSRIMVWDDNQIKALSNANWSGAIQYYPFDTLNTNYTGGNEAHTNIPPYLAVNMWKRVS